MNLIDFNFIDKINLILKEISETEGPGVLVTVASGKKVFSSGFNIKKIFELHYPILGATFIQSMLANILTLNMPSLCVVDGHVIAGGIFIPLCHDKIIMTSKPKIKWQLNEVHIGAHIPLGLTNLVKYSCGNGHLSR